MIHVWETMLRITERGSLGGNVTWLELSSDAFVNIHYTHYPHYYFPPPTTPHTNFSIILNQSNTDPFRFSMSMIIIQKPRDMTVTSYHPSWINLFPKHQKEVIVVLNAVFILTTYQQSDKKVIFFSLSAFLTLQSTHECKVLLHIHIYSLFSCIDKR